MSQFEFDSLPQRAPKTSKRRAHHISTHQSDSSEPVIPDSGTKPRVAEDTVSTQSEISNELSAQTRSVSPQFCVCRDEASIQSLSQFEYLDHPADVQIHAWGSSLPVAFESCAIGMFAYMTTLAQVECTSSIEIRASGHDLDSLLFSFLDNLLYAFASDNFVTRRIWIHEFDLGDYSIRATCTGEMFDFDKHEQGTEVKAITYSNMQIRVDDTTERCDVYVIVDI